jgi:hypothetical protein
VWLHLGDNFAIGSQHKPQDAMRTGVLRPHVDQHLIGADIELNDPLIVIEQLRHDVPCDPRGPV